MLNGKPYDIDCYYLTKYESEFTPVLSNQGAPAAEPSEIAGTLFFHLLKL